MNEGFKLAFASNTASIDEVVVLPCVPATETARFILVIALKISARLTTGMPRFLASIISIFLSVTAVERATISICPTLDKSCPIATSMPEAVRRSNPDEFFKSLPDTECPIEERTNAIALIPAPPIPTI